MYVMYIHVICTCIVLPAIHIFKTFAVCAGKGGGVVSWDIRIFGVWASKFCISCEISEATQSTL